MKDHVTIVPSDNVIIVNYEALKFEFPYPDNVHAIQWHNGSGHIEFNDGTFNQSLTTEQEYNIHIKPYVNRWEEEKANQPIPEPEPEPEPITLEKAKEQKLKEIMTAYDNAFAPINAIYPAKEREGWAVQEAEAKAVLSDPAAETPVLTILVSLRGLNETVEELAEKVLHNAAQWRLIYAHLTGQQQRMYGEVQNIEGIGNVQNYVVKYSLPEVYNA